MIDRNTNVQITDEAIAFAKPMLAPVRVLNLYACLGGNRYKWDEVANIEVTAVEWDEELAKLYQDRFPNDTVIVADAEFKLSIVKRKKSILEKDHEKAWMKVIDAENKLNDKEEALINMEKCIRSLASKLSWAKRKNK